MRPAVRTSRPVPAPVPTIDIQSNTPSPTGGIQPDPYHDYGRYLTPEGGVLFIYKDIDTRWQHTLWRLSAWSASTAAAAWYVLHDTPVETSWINIVGLLILAVVNWFIVAKPVELYRKVELRPDCMIIEDVGVFWLSQMENGLPTFRVDEDGNQIMYGLYGSRFVEYLTIRRFDDFDGMPEVFAAHLQAAMQQLWATALATGTVAMPSRPWQGHG
jgi:hypothetical protein